MTLKLSYIALSLCMTIILAAIAFFAINKTFQDSKTRPRKKWLLVLGLLGWHIYVFAIASTDVLQNFSFPPRFALFLIFPLLIFTGIFMYKNRNAAWLDNIPAHWLVFFQTFRILVEIIFVFSVAQGILNKEVTIEGYNYDMIFGITAAIVGYLFWKRIISRKIVVAWNYLGLIVLASVNFLFVSSIFNPQLFGSEAILLPMAVVKYPYVLVAGFLMPLAVFVHVVSIVQLGRKKEKQNI